MKKMALDETISRLQNLVEWADTEKSLESLNDDEIDALKNGLEFLQNLKKLCSA